MTATLGGERGEGVGQQRCRQTQIKRKTDSREREGGFEGQNRLHKSRPGRTGRQVCLGTAALTRETAFLPPTHTYAHPI